MAAFRYNFFLSYLGHSRFVVGDFDKWDNDEDGEISIEDVSSTSKLNLLPGPPIWGGGGAICPPPGPQRPKDLVFEDFHHFDCRKCPEMHFKPI